MAGTPHEPRTPYPPGSTLDAFYRFRLAYAELVYATIHALRHAR